MANTDARVALVAGASVGLGSALCSSFLTRGYRVIALGRDRAVREVSAALPSVRAIACELASERDVATALSNVESNEGSATAVVYNAHRLALQSFADTSLELFEQVWRANCLGAATVAASVLPAMKARGAGALLFVGATASVRGGKQTAAFASSKFALRGLAQSLAREYAPHKVHVVHAVLDGLIWSPQTEARFAPRREDCMDPDELAEQLVRLTEQPASTWTHEVDVRPWKEKF